MSSEISSLSLTRPPGLSEHFKRLHGSFRVLQPGACLKGWMLTFTLQLATLNHKRGLLARFSLPPLTAFFPIHKQMQMTYQSLTL